MTKIRGTVKLFKEDKGYGFIVPDNAGPDIFVHISDVKESGYDGLAKGDKVEFELGESRGKPKASRISIFN